jgi:hypothetical protein
MDKATVRLHPIAFRGELPKRLGLFEGGIQFVPIMMSLTVRRSWPLKLASGSSRARCDPEIDKAFDACRSTSSVETGTRNIFDLGRFQRAAGCPHMAEAVSKDRNLDLKSLIL